MSGVSSRTACRINDVNFLEIHSLAITYESYEQHPALILLRHTAHVFTTRAVRVVLFSVVSVCDFVCLFVCQHNNS